MSHTPRPWRSVYDGSSTWSVGEDADPQDRPVASVGRRGGLDSWEEAADNAILIAAAPDLLHALKELMAAAKGELPDEWTVLGTAADAIAKAEGR